MLRKIACAVAVLAVSLGFAMAEEIKGRITKIDGGKVTVMTGKDQSKDLDLAKDVKVYKKTKDAKEEIAGGLSADPLKTIDAKKGVGATVITNADGKVTEIILTPKKTK